MSTGICMIECCNRAMQLRFKLEPDKDVTVNDLLQMARAKTDCVLVAKWNNLVMEDDAIYSPHYPITLHCQSKKIQERVVEKPSVPEVVTPPPVVEERQEIQIAPVTKRTVQLPGINSTFDLYLYNDFKEFCEYNHVTLLEIFQKHMNINFDHLMCLEVNLYDFYITNKFFPYVVIYKYPSLVEGYCSFFTEARNGILRSISFFIRAKFSLDSSTVLGKSLSDDVIKKMEQFLSIKFDELIFKIIRRRCYDANTRKRKNIVGGNPKRYSIAPITKVPASVTLEALEETMKPLNREDENEVIELYSKHQVARILAIMNLQKQFTDYSIITFITRKLIHYQMYPQLITMDYNYYAMDRFQMIPNLIDELRILTNKLLTYAETSKINYTKYQDNVLTAIMMIPDVLTKLQKQSKNIQPLITLVDDTSAITGEQSVIRDANPYLYGVLNPNGHVKYFIIIDRVIFPLEDHKSAEDAVQNLYEILVLFNLKHTATQYNFFYLLDTVHDYIKTKGTINTSTGALKSMLSTMISTVPNETSDSFSSLADSNYDIPSTSTVKAELVDRRHEERDIGGSSYIEESFKLYKTDVCSTSVDEYVAFPDESSRGRKRKHNQRC